MIKNERQHRITKAHAEKFRATLNQLASTARPKERLARGAADASTAEEVIAVAAVSSVTSRRKVLVFCHGVPVRAAASRGPSLFTSDRSAADPAN